jgi:hypothetical protein
MVRPRLDGPPAAASIGEELGKLSPVTADDDASPMPRRPRTERTTTIIITTTT